MDHSMQTNYRSLSMGRLNLFAPNYSHRLVYSDLDTIRRCKLNDR